MYPSNYPNFQDPRALSSYDRINGNINGYQGQYGYQNFPQNNQTPPPQTNITFVNGMEGAKAFQLSPNSNFLMMDAENSRFYVKTTDSLGIASINSYSFVADEIQPVQEQVPPIQPNIGNLATIDDLNEIKNSMQELIKRFNELSEVVSSAM